MRHDIVLSGHGVHLVPLAPEHADGLFDFVDTDLWAGMAAPRPGTSGELAALFRSRLDDPGTIPFAVTDRRTGALLGTTSLRAYDPAQQRLEIRGNVFPGVSSGATTSIPRANTCSSLTRLRYWRFTGWPSARDARNTRSATAIERLGARFEGILRGHRTAPAGGRSDIAVFSILTQEWPQVRADLRRRLAPFAVEDDYAFFPVS